MMVKTRSKTGLLLNYNSLWVIVVAVAMTGCNLSFTSLEYKRGQKALGAQDYREALGHFKKVINRDPESEMALNSAREAAKISFFQIRDFAVAEEFYTHLVRYSRDEQERRAAQKAIANIYFEKLSNYPRAIEEYNKLLNLRSSKEEQVDYHFKIARSQFYLNHFQEAHHEVESALKITENRDEQFELKVFGANVDFNTRHLDAAVKTYEELINTFPEKARAENIAMNLIVCYEEQDQFDKAITVLEELRPTHKDTEFIDLKIKRLKERKANMPGSKGLRK